MNILFIHQNFPGQFKHLAPALAARGHRVLALHMRKGAASAWQGVQLVSYSTRMGSTPRVHPWVADFETKVIRAEACFRKALELKAQGFEPHLVIAHPGWGESLFVKEVWPAARLGVYCEFFYQPHGGDVGFDPEFPVRDVGDACRLQMKNLNQRLHFDLADAGLSPTHWQAQTFPEPFRQRITVVHDGIDTATVAPDPAASFAVRGGPTLSRADELVTFVNRNLEPYRGFHVFMRALPALLRRRPRARVVLVGGDDVSYGARPEGGGSWKDRLLREVRPQIPDADWARVFFVGNLPYAEFLALLRVSTVHVYLTYPFVLSWSLLEAMSTGCAIVASDTAPVREVIQHGQTGLLVDFFDTANLTAQVGALLDDAVLRAQLGASARAFVRKHYDLKAVCLPQQLAWVGRLAEKACTG